MTKKNKKEEFTTESEPHGNNYDSNIIQPENKLIEVNLEFILSIKLYDNYYLNNYHSILKKINKFIYKFYKSI